MANETKDVIEFGPFRLTSSEATLTRSGVPVSLPPKAFEMLVYLTANAGRLIGKEELLQALWPDSFVEEANLTVNVATLRRALGTQDDGRGWIETVSKRGYRFLGVVRIPSVAAAEPGIAAPSNRKRVTAIVAVAVVLLALLAGLTLEATRHRGVGSPARLSIAVLPFQDISTSSGEAHEGLGMTDALITRLSTLPQLAVRPLASIRKYDGTAFDILEATRALKVDTVLTGTLQRLDKRVRVSVSLTRVDDGQSLWAEKFDEFATNTFAVQDAISEKVAKVLMLRLTSEEQDRMLRRYTESTEAFRLYELGRYQRYHHLSASREYFERAIAQDGRYALPYVELAKMYLGFSGNGRREYDKYVPLAREMLGNALRYSPDLAETHVASADMKRVVDRDYRGAQQELDLALKLNPGSAKVHDARAYLLAIVGDLNAAKLEANQAGDLDPFDAEVNENQAWILHCNHEYRSAIALLDRFKERDPRQRFEWTRFYSLLQLGRASDALALIGQNRTDEKSRVTAAILAHVHAVAGRRQEALDLLRTLPSDWGFYQRALVEVALGDRDSALADLDRSVEERSVWVGALRSLA